MQKIIISFFFILLNINCLLANNSNESTLLYSDIKNDTTFSIINNHIFLKKITLNTLNISDGFILDTGSNISVIDISIFNKLHLKSYKTVENIDVLRNTKVVKSVKLDSLKIGNNLFLNVTVIVLDLGSSECGDQIKGIIGNDILKKEIIKIDFNKRKIEFLGSLEVMKGFEKVPFKLKKNLPYITLKIGEETFKNCLLDLGNVNDISLIKEDLNLIDKNLVNNKKYYKLYSNSINSSMRKVYEAPLLNIKKASFESLDIINAEVSFYLKKRSIGLGLFYDTVLILDFRGKYFYINKSQILINNNLVEKHFIKIDWDKNFFISQLKMDSLILKNDIKIGDIITSINNIDLTKDQDNKKKCETLKILNNELKKDTLIIKLDRWQSSKEIIFNSN